MPAATHPLHAAIRASGQQVHDPAVAHLLWPDDVLQAQVHSGLTGMNLAQPLRRRAGVARAAVVRCLGYEPPRTWSRVRPRVPAQDLEVIVLKAHNVQLWNDELVAARRYLFLQLDEDDRVAGARVVRGATLQRFGSGRRTWKRQALCPTDVHGSRLLSLADTPPVQALLDRPSGTSRNATATTHPTSARSALAPPQPGELLPVRELHEAVCRAVGAVLPDPGPGQERRAGDSAHQLICTLLGLEPGDSGQCPDIPAQLCEVKLTRSATLDLGAADPDDSTPSPNLPSGLSYADLRYVVLHARTTGDAIQIIGVTTTCGPQFHSFFPRCATRDSKLQFALPRDFFPDGLPVVPGRAARKAARSRAPLNAPTPAPEPPSRPQTTEQLRLF